MEDVEAVTQKPAENTTDVNVQVLPPPGTVPTSIQITDPRKEDYQTSDVKIDMTKDNVVEAEDTSKSNEKEEVEESKETRKPLLEEETVKIDIKPDGEGEDTPTLPLSDKKKKDSSETEENQKEKLPAYLFPFTRIKDAWNESSNVWQFFGRSILIIFQTVGWFTCVGGVPFLSLAMLIIGSIYVNNCKIEPNIPVYLIVSGVIGTLQHVITIWTKYVPKNSQGRLKVYRSYCNATNGIFHLFLIIWFILGCIWVYSVHSEVEFSDPAKDEYCHKTLYYFTFWILNLSFILLGILVVLSLCVLICIAATAKE